MFTGFLGILVLFLETGFYHLYKQDSNPNIFLRSLDTFFGGKNKEQSRELQSGFVSHNDSRRETVSEGSARSKTNKNEEDVRASVLLALDEDDHIKEY